MYFPAPPTAGTPQPEHAIVTVVTGAIVAGIGVYSLVTWRRRGTPVHLALLCGGAISVLNEVPLSYAGHFYYPRPGAWKAFEAYGRVIPWWVLFAYTIYVGGLAIGLFEWLRRGITRGRVWAGVGVICLFNAILEVSVLRTDNYFYYGHQPLRIDRFPSIWMAMNVIAVLGTCAVLLGRPDLFTGRRVWSLLVVAPLCQLAGDWFGTPHFMALNSNASDGFKTTCTLTSIGLCAVVVDVLARYLVRAVPAPAPVTIPSSVRRRVPA